MMFVGHIAIGGILCYLLYKLDIKNYSYPLALLFTILPDVDIIIGYIIPLVVHKTVTHSFLILSGFGLYYILTRNRTIFIYMCFYISHFAGDLIIEKINLLYPFYMAEVGLWIKFSSRLDILIELLLLTINITILIIDKSFHTFIRINYLKRLRLNNVLNYLLIVSLITSNVFVILVIGNLSSIDQYLVTVTHLLGISYFYIYIRKFDRF